MISPTSVNPYSLPSLPLPDAHSLPPISALYFCTSDSHLLYIGITKDLKQRWEAHHKTIALLNYPDVKIHWLAIAPEQVSKTLESSFIHYWRPKLNQQLPNLIPLSKNQFIKFCGNTSQHIAKLGLQGRTHDVLWYLLGSCDMNNCVEISQTKIATELDMTPQQVSRAIKQLQEFELIIPLSQAPKFKTKLNRKHFWRGSTSSSPNPELPDAG